MPEIPYAPPKRNTLWHVLNGMTGGMVGFGGGYYADKATYDRQHEEAVRAQRQLDHDDRLTKRMEEQRMAGVLESLRNRLAELGGTYSPDMGANALRARLGDNVRLKQMQTVADESAREDDQYVRQIATQGAMQKRQDEVDRLKREREKADKLASMQENYMAITGLSPKEIEGIGITPGSMRATLQKSKDDREVELARRMAGARQETKPERNELGALDHIKAVEEFRSYFQRDPELDATGRITGADMKMLGDHRARLRIGERNSMADLLRDAMNPEKRDTTPKPGGAKGPQPVVQWDRDPVTGILRRR